MQLDTALRLVMATKEIFPASKNDVDITVDAWMALFGSKDDGLMETAIRLCWTSCKFFPTPAEITEAIKDLAYEEQIKPKQIPWEVKRSDALHQEIMDIASGNVSVKEHLNSIDITKMMEYAKEYIPDITEEIVRRSIPELIDCMRSTEMCWECRVSKQACNQMKLKPMMDNYGYVVTCNTKCEKVDRR